MGVIGTEVAKEASAIDEERSIYNSIKAFIRFGNRWFIRQEQTTLTIFADTIRKWRAHKKRCLKFFPSLRLKVSS